MSVHHITSGEVVPVRLQGEQLKETPSTALIKTDNIEVMRLVLEAGKSIQEHVVAREMTFYCLEGKVELQAHQRTQVLNEGDLVYLEAMQPYALQAVEDTALLVTILLHEGSASPLDVPMQ